MTLYLPLPMSIKKRGLKKTTIGGIVLLISFAIAILVLSLPVVRQSDFSLKISDIIYQPSTRKVLLPAGFQLSDQAIKHIQGDASEEKWNYIQLKSTEKSNFPPRNTGYFKDYNTFLYEQTESTDCKNAARSETFSIDETHQLPVNITKILEIYFEETFTHQEGFNQRIEPFLNEFMNKENQTDAFFRFSGSSVWLKDYNVHYVVSRLVVSKRKLRNEASISLLLAQIYDESWNELEDVRMVLPSNTVEDSPGFEIDGQSFIVHRFPKILPTPFEIVQQGIEKEPWGAEDPRTLLVRNKNGYEEPVVVYNSLHLSEIKNKIDLYQRSMFMTFPFQLQRGLNSPTSNRQDFSDEWFSRSKKLSINGQEPISTEKNWTPFVSQNYLFDKHIMFAVQLEPLIIIKCELLTNNGECVIYGAPNEKKVGPLRGGTPLLSLRLDKEQDKEYFVGFARAHLKNCGCGNNFYRPNLMGILRHGASWKLTHITSSIDLGMKVTSWTVEGAELCEENNVMLPNGIEYLDHELDTLSLLLSISDNTVERVHVKGVLKALESANFWDTEAKADMSPVSCALEESRTFCRVYGDRIEGRIPGRFV